MVETRDEDRALTLDEVLQLHDRGIFQREEVFGLLVEMLTPSILRSVQEVVRDRGWDSGFAPWLKGAAEGRPHGRSGKVVFPTKAVRDAAAAWLFTPASEVVPFPFPVERSRREGIEEERLACVRDALRLAETHERVAREKEDDAPMSAMAHRDLAWAARQIARVIEARHGIGIREPSACTHAGAPVPETCSCAFLNCYCRGHGCAGGS